ncbi:hypothetical protein AB0395_35155 [Streptosporangium sp. NPDC051023]|uniref:hypothetical protein n=1 Tax=Streptosporangium sp. NPDC051023 TaxID=3155410 RepID=UPI00344D89AC
MAVRDGGLNGGPESGARVMTYHEYFTLQHWNDLELRRHTIQRALYDLERCTIDAGYRIKGSVTVALTAMRWRRHWKRRKAPGPLVWRFSLTTCTPLVECSAGQAQIIRMTLQLNAAPRTKRRGPTGT